MNRTMRLSGISILLILTTITFGETVSLHPIAGDDAVVVTIIYDNYADDPSLGTDWGFAALIEYGQDRLLFDAGRQEKLFQTNLEKLGIEISGIPGLFISHEHGDHTGGMNWITGVNPSIKCFLPDPYASKLKKENELPENGKGIPHPQHLYGPFYSTGDNFDRFREHALVVKTESGGILVTGCGHPGVVDMIKVSEKDLGIKIHTVIGGLHLLRTPDKKVEEIAKKLDQMGIRTICPTHCTGDGAIKVLQESFEEGYMSGGTGKQILIPATQ